MSSDCAENKQPTYAQYLRRVNLPGKSLMATLANTCLAVHHATKDHGIPYGVSVNYRLEG